MKDAPPARAWCEARVCDSLTCDLCYYYVCSALWDPFHLIITPSADHHAQLISTQNNKYCLHSSLQLKLKRQIVQIFRASLNNARGAAENWHSIDSWCLSRSGDVGGVYKCFLHAVLNDLMIDLPQCWWAIIPEFGDIILLNQSLTDKWLLGGWSDDCDGFSCKLRIRHIHILHIPVSWVLLRCSLYTVIIVIPITQ